MFQVEEFRKKFHTCRSFPLSYKFNKSFLNILLASDVFSETTVSNNTVFFFTRKPRGLNISVAVIISEKKQ